MLTYANFFLAWSESRSNLIIFLEYYRVIMSVQELYDAKFGDRNSEEFMKFAEKIVSGLEKLLRPRRASYTPSFISIK